MTVEFGCEWKGTRKLSVALFSNSLSALRKTSDGRKKLCVFLQLSGGAATLL
jgi:hypothetical protein